MPEIGFLATIASLTITFAGLPAQIFKNYHRGNCEGISPILVYSACCSYILWGLYGWTKPDWFLATAQTPGAVFAFILLGQLLYYRMKHRTVHS